MVYNRLKIAKKLEIDATVLYAIQQHKVSNTQSDRATDSPYNTYKYEGLPPTPIAGLTEASLKAALNPADTTFLYYVVIDKAGHQKFATTGEEHQHNVDIARSLGLLG